MSTLRQRKPTADGDHEDPPVLLSECDSSWDKSFDGDDGEGDETKPALSVAQQPAPSAGPGPLDSFLSTYGSFSGATFTADQGLKILQWSSWAISYATRSGRAIGGKELSPAMGKLSGEISYTRYVLRFYGFLQSLEGYRSGSWAGGAWDNPLIGKVAKYLMAGSMLFYYPLEHAAYAGWQMPKLVKVNANKVSAVSCVFWTTYIVGDFWTSCLKWKELNSKFWSLRMTINKKKLNDDKDAVAELREEENAVVKKMRHIRLQIVRCLLFILPAVNWSLPKWATDPMLDEFPLNGLMLAEAYTSVYQSLRSMCG